jgi:hypothetical protein
VKDAIIVGARVVEGLSLQLTVAVPDDGVPLINRTQADLLIEELVLHARRVLSARGDYDLGNDRMEDGQRIDDLIARGILNPRSRGVK